ncbi:Carboxypeptidase Y [Penicillium rolfsii]|nr:Carboxypeptidase Y [Penicillium rolfsii]
MNIAPFLFFLQILRYVSNLAVSKTAKASRFEVHSLPDSPALPASWAGRLPVPGRKDGNKIFFWLFGAENKAYDDTFIIWLNGGPGCSSLVGLTGGNGPISFVDNSTQIKRNPYSWTQLGHVLYVDQPVGTGFSTASNPYPVRDNDMVTTDFVAWLNSFFTYFPLLQSKKIHLMGESYAGIYIPHFTAALMESNTLHPLDIRSISLGDGSWGNAAAMSSVSIGAYMRSQATALKIPKDILAAFEAAEKVCGFDDVLDQAQVYPPNGKIDIPGNPENLNYRRRRRDMTDVLNASCSISPKTVSDVNTSIFNSTCYGPCAIHSTAMDYMDTASNTGTGIPCFDVYDIHHNCSTINSMALMAEYFSRTDVQDALHVSDRGAYSACNSTILGVLLGASSVVPPAYAILPSLVAHNISLHIYNGEWDMLLSHIGTEISIQNMTWRGAQGFSTRPQRLFYVDDAMPVDSHHWKNATTKVAGYWAEERGVSYHLFRGAGHSVFANKPREMFAYVRDVVVGGEQD